METIKERYEKDLRVCWDGDQHMIDYCLKKFSGATEFENGDYIVFDKPSIETRFCFGHGFCGRTTDEDEDRANNMAEHARTSEEYFIEENLKGLKEKIEWFLDDRYNVCIHAYYLSEPESCNYKGYSFYHPFETPHIHGEYRDLTMDERRAVVETLNQEIEKFTKRLKTYLKRYGLSKVYSWTFLMD